ncbi:protein ACCELERATED CELL DEATH 6 [Quercus suber]|uniref:protein ACCELERATED CELL DEATH 6 n=1 Tax=Quercus suber TaxID=58331 RepID=UPI0032DEB841
MAAAVAGDVELVKLMIIINHLPDVNGKSIAYAAIFGAFTTKNIGKTGYGAIVRNEKGDVMAAMTASGLNVHTSEEVELLASWRAIEFAVDVGFSRLIIEDVLDTVLKNLPDDFITTKDDKVMTPLCHAAPIGHLNGFKHLLGKRTKYCAYERDTHGFYPIHIATMKGHIQVIEVLLHEFPDIIELFNQKGQNILHVAAMSGKAKVVAYMLKRRDFEIETVVNRQDNGGNIPLHLASKGRHPKVVSIFTWDKSVYLKSLNEEGEIALDIAVNYTGNSPYFRESYTKCNLNLIISRIKNPQGLELGKILSTNKYKDRVDTLLLVTTLVVTVTFAAAFTYARRLQ